MKENVKYRYALDHEGTVVDVTVLTSLDRRDYKCLSCSEVLRPVIGQVRRKHFRHMVDVDCSEETYLHRLGKALFVQVYQACLDQGDPFEVEFLQPRVCTHCDDYGPCDLEPERRRYDLTRAFRNVTVETPDDGLIPDVLLSTDTGEKLYIEIAVTHLSTDDKRSSGNRIIELAVGCEDDLQLIHERLLSERDERVELINFNPQTALGSYPTECNQQCDTFVLWHTGRSRIITCKPFEFQNRVGGEVLYTRRVRFRNAFAYVHALEEAYLAGHTVKSCFLCRYHAKSSSRQWVDSGKPVFCKFLKVPAGSNDAAECEYYKPDESVFRYSGANGAEQAMVDFLPE